jgi:hypothetical protein
MRLLRMLGGSLLWIVAGLLGLLGVLMTVTLVLAPLGIPLLMLAKKVFKYSMTMFLPRKVRHPLQEAGKSVSDKASDISMPSMPSLDLGKRKKKMKKALKKQRKQLPV